MVLYSSNDLLCTTKKEGLKTDILQKNTAQYFGTMCHGIKRSGKTIYKARNCAKSDLGVYANGKQLSAVNYSTRRKASMNLFQRVLER